MKKLLFLLLTPFAAQAIDDHQIFAVDPQEDTAICYYWQTNQCNDQDIGIYNPLDPDEALDITVSHNELSGLNIKSAQVTLQWEGDVVTVLESGKSATIPKDVIAFYADCGAFWSTVNAQNADANASWWDFDLTSVPGVLPYDLIVSATYNGDSKAQMYCTNVAGAEPVFVGRQCD